MVVVQGHLRPGGRLFLWGEASVAPGRPAPRPGAGPQVHPGAASRRELRRALTQAAGARPLGKLRAAEATLDLPTLGGAPVASPAAGRREHQPEAEAPRAPWRVPGYEVAVDQALDFLRDPPDPQPPRLAWGDWIVLAFYLVRLADRVVQRGQVCPGLEADPGSPGWRARWWAAPRGALAAELERLTRLAPGQCFAQLGTREEGLGPHLDQLVDAVARARLGANRGGEGPTEGVAHDPRTPSPELASLLAGLEGPETWVPDHGGRSAVLAQVLRRSRWRAQGSSRAAFRTLVRVEESADEDSPWLFVPLAQALDEPSVCLEPRELVRPVASVRSTLRRLGPSPLEAVSQDLAALGRRLPALRAWVDQVPGPISATPDQVLEWLEPLLAAAGEAEVEVQVPTSWSEGVRRLGWKLEATGVDAAEVDLSGVNPHDRFGREALARFDWKLALGGAPLSLDEIQRLADHQRPLVRFKDRWVRLDDESLQAARRFLAGEVEAPPAPLVWLARQRAGVDPGPLGLEVEEVEASGWLASLLEGSGLDAPLPPEVEASLRPYQREGVAWLRAREARGVGALLADDMGLGKTFQVLALLRAERAAEEAVGPTLVVAPLSVLAAWEAEAGRWAPGLRVGLHHGEGRGPVEDLVASSDLVLTSYDLVARERAAFAAVAWHRVVLDEAQAVKSSRTRRAQAVYALRAPRRLALTGTPVENRLTELWSIFRFLNPGLLGPRKDFVRSLAGPIEREADGIAFERLRRLISPFLLRRTKEDPGVLPDLPPKLERTWPCRLTVEQVGLYRAVTDEMFATLQRAEGMARRGLVLAGLTKLKQVCNHPAHLLGEAGADPARSGKLQVLASLLDRAAGRGERVVVFTQYRVFGELLQGFVAAQRGAPPDFLHGGVSRRARAAMIQAFQEGPEDGLLLVSLKAAGTGVDLSAARHVVHADLWWNPAVEDQASDRAHRPGQAGQLQVHRLVTRGTLEDRIEQMLDEKRDLAERVLEGGEDFVTELSDRELRRLVELAPREAQL